MYMGLFNNKGREQLKETLRMRNLRIDELDRTTDVLRITFENKEKKLVADHRMEIDRLKNQHLIEIDLKNHDMKHLESNKVLELKNENTTLQSKVQVLEKENEMLGKITDLNADVIDVKGLVKDLIKKLPEINISNLSVNAQPSK
jgi:hypothetical protein